MDTIDRVIARLVGPLGGNLNRDEVNGILTVLIEAERVARDPSRGTDELRDTLATLGQIFS